MPPRRLVLPLGGGLLAALIGAVLVYPLLAVVVAAAGNGGSGVQSALLAPGSARAWTNSLWVGAASSLLAVTVATVAVVATTGVRGPLVRAIRAAMVLPILVPPFASAVGWSQAYGPGGITDALFHLQVRAVLGPAGVLAAIATEVMPIAFLVLAGSAAINGRQEPVLAARASGSSRWGAHLRVGLPLLWPAIGAALVLTFLASVNNFAVPAVLGTPAGFETLTSRIYNDLNFATRASAFAESQVLAAGLAIVSLLVLWPAARATRPGQTPVLPGRGTNDRRPPAAAIATLSLYLAVAVVGPLLALFLTAVTRAPGLLPSPANWGLGNFTQALAGPRFLPALLNSVALAFCAATLLVALSVALAVVDRRRGGRALVGAVTLGFAVPGSVVAVGFLLSYSRWIGGSLLLILLAYIAKLWALAHRPVSAGVHGLPAGLARAARASGAGPADALRTVVLPALAPTLWLAWLVVLLFGLHEVTISSLLYGPTTQTLAVLVLNVEQVGDVGTTAALACVLTLLVVVPALPLALLLRRRRIQD